MKHRLFVASYNGLTASKLVGAILCWWCLVTGETTGTELKSSLWGPDTVGQELLADPRDPTFESVANRFPMLQLPREALGVPEGRDEFILLPDSSIEVSNARWHVAPENRATVYFLLGVEKQRFGQGTAPDAKRLHEGYLPLVTTPFAHDGLGYEQTVFAWSEKMVPDSEARLWAYVELAVKNPSDRARSVSVACQVDCGLPLISVPAGQWTLDVPARDTKSLLLKIPYDGTQPREASTDPNKVKKPSRYAELPYCGGFRGSEIVEKREYRQRFEQVASTWRAHAKIATHRQDIHLAMIQRQVTLKRRQPTDKQIAWAKKVLAVKNQTERDKLPHLAEAYAGRVLGMSKGPASVTVPLQVVQVGDLAVCAIPFEAFVEIGLELKKRSPFPRTMVIGLANGNYGYLPTPAQHKLGGYETWLGSNSVEEDASVILVNNLLEMLGELKRVAAKKTSAE